MAGAHREGRPRAMVAHTEIETTWHFGTSADLEQPSTVEATQSHQVKTIKQTLSKLPLKCIVQHTWKVLIDYTVRHYWMDTDDRKSKKIHAL